MKKIKLWILKFFTRKIETHNRIKVGDTLYKPTYSTEPSKMQEYYQEIGVVTELRISDEVGQQGYLLVKIQR